MEKTIEKLKAQVAELEEMLKEFSYDYRAAVKADCVSYIKEMLEYGTITLADLTSDEGINRIRDLCWVSDDVTGNGSGSYAYSTHKAECYLCHNLSLYVEAIQFYGTEIKQRLDPESMDVTIRCYLLEEVLPGAIAEVKSEALKDLDDANGPEWHRDTEEGN